MLSSYVSGFGDKKYSLKNMLTINVWVVQYIDAYSAVSMHIQTQLFSGLYNCVLFRFYLEMLNAKKALCSRGNMT